VARRPDLLAILAMLFLFSTFGLNFPIFISTMSVMVFHGDAKQYGFLTSAMAIGSVIGAFFAAGRKQPRITLLVGSAALFCCALVLASALPYYALFVVTLIVLGICAQTFNTAANSAVQLASEPGIRGRVMAMYLAILLGGTPLGAPFAGWVADTFGARCGLIVGAAAGLSAALVGVHYLRRYRGMCVRWVDGRPQLILRSPSPGTAA
jgi:MFS family permease